MTQKEIILKHLSSMPGKWVKAYELRGKPTAFGFTGHQADRRARELANEGKIEHRIYEGYAEYRAKGMQEFIDNFPKARAEAIEATNKGRVGSLFLT